MNGSPSCFSLKWRQKGRHLPHCHGTSCYSFQTRRWWMCSGSVPQSKPAEKESQKLSVSPLGCVPYDHLMLVCDLQPPRHPGTQLIPRREQTFPKQTFNHYSKSQQTHIRERSGSSKVNILVISMWQVCGGAPGCLDF